MFSKDSTAGKLFLSNWFICLSLTALIMGGMAHDIFPLQNMEWNVYDALAAIRKNNTESPVVLIYIDDDSIRSLGDWPWPRTRVAEVIKKVSGYGPSTLGIELLYTSAEDNPGLEKIIELRDGLKKNSTLMKSRSVRKIYADLLQTEKELDGDASLYNAVFSARRAILPIRFSMGSFDWQAPINAPSWLNRHSIEINSWQGDSASPNRSFGNSVTVLKEFEVSGIDVKTSHEGLAPAAGRHGHINAVKDRDGVVRKEALLIPFNGRLFPSFSLRLAMAYQGDSLRELIVDQGVNGVPGIELKRTKIPTDRNFRMLVDFNGSENAITRYSFIDVLEGTVPGEMFASKAVLLGVTGSAAGELFNTPVSAGLSAVELTAYSAANILNGTFFSRPHWGLLVESALLVYFAILLILVVPRLSVRMGAIILGSFLITWYAFAFVLFIAFGLWLKVIPPTLLAGVGFALVTLRRIPVEGGDEAEKTESNKTLGLSFQSQGMLDMAFDKFMQCPVKDKSVKELLYNLGLDFERKRMFSKAVTVYQHILKGGKFKDVKERIERIKKAGDALLAANGGLRKGGPINLENMGTRPTLGRYEVVKIIGRGAMGTVYLGRDPRINREVAIKAVTYDDIEPGQLMNVKKRFFREAEAAGKLNHPNIVTIYDVGEDHDMAYIAMELLKGEDLAAHTSKENLFPIEKTLNVVAEIADALDYAHRNGVVHRDIKPANIMVLGSGKVKVTDFGIAQVMSASKTQTGVLVGTPNYMSPEQVSGKKVDGRSDLFSLGAVFYELLSGQKPFKGENMAALMYNISNTSYPPLSKVASKVTPCCEEIVDRLLSKAVTRRYKNAAELAREVRDCRQRVN